MMKPVPVIKGEYIRYKSLSYDKKTTTLVTITFATDKPSRPDTLYHLSPLTHVYRVDVIHFIAEQRKVNRCSYKFQIRCPDFCDKPIFRFDSDGSTHQNKRLPLGQQQMLTPHFNNFDENGEAIAYKTTELENVKYEELKDMSKFFLLFCKECYLVMENDSPPSIQAGDVRVLDFDLNNEDLLSDVTFVL